MSTKYTYSIQNDFLNQKVATDRLQQEIGESTIVVALDYIAADSIGCDVWFKTTLTSPDEATLSGIVVSHDGEPLVESTGPKAVDDRPIVRADSRPISYQTMFTMAGDDEAIGDGKSICWDFSNDDDLVTASGVVPDGYKLKRIQISFCDGIYIKEGTIYFFDALKESYINFSVVCPNGQYYYDRNKNPVQATEDTVVIRYINRHYFSGSCPMGDELNTEGCSEDPLPQNYQVWIEVYVPESDDSSHGHGELELYRLRTYLYPGEAQ